MLKEIEGYLFEQKADALCITTNGFVKNDGTCVMGAGCAKEAKRQWPIIASRLGGVINSGGNHVYHLGHYGKSQVAIISFPVKHKWWEKADLGLIAGSACELADMIQKFQWKRVILPRPGCGCGKLKWNDVKPVLEDMFKHRGVDNIVKIITFPPREDYYVDGVDGPDRMEEGDK